MHNEKPRRSRQDLARELRGITPDDSRLDPNAGCIYALLYSNGIVKVGRTRESNVRMSQHYSDAARFGIRVVRQWVSWPHGEVKDNEFRLIGFAEENSRGLVAGREYFRDGDFMAIVAYARTLSGAVHPQRGVYADIGANSEPDNGGVVDTERLLSLADISHLTGIDIAYLVDIVTANWRSTRPLSLPA